MPCRKVLLELRCYFESGVYWDGVEQAMKGCRGQIVHERAEHSAGHSLWYSLRWSSWLQCATTQATVCIGSIVTLQYELSASLSNECEY